MKNKASTIKRDFLLTNQTPECQKRELRPPKGQNLAGVDDSGVPLLYSKGFLTKQMRLYVAKAITDSGREIRCEKKDCRKYEDLEFHHKKYKNVRIKDIRILCGKHHRNSKIPKNCRSRLKTIFENGKRFCEVSEYKFEY